MGQRVLQVVGALAVLAVVAVLARPSQPDVPPPFTVERETPQPDGVPTPEATPAPGEPPEATPVPPPGTVLTLQRVDGQTLEPDGPPAVLHFSVLGARAELSPDGRWLAVAVPQPHPAAATLLRLYETSALAAQDLDPRAEVTVPAFADWFSFMPEGGGVVWLENHERAGLRAGGVTFEGSRASRLETVDLPPHLWLYGIAALRDGRVGLVASPETGRSPAGWGLAAPRLLVADLHAGTLTFDLELPLPPAMVVADEQGRVELVPGVAWDVARDRLYVAHADREAVLVADLARGTLAGHLEVLDPRGDGEPEAAAAHRMWPARALAQPADTLSEGTWREAVLSDDGSTLYVHGAYLAAREPRAEGQPVPPRRRRLPVLGIDVDALAPFALDGAPRAEVLAVSPRAEHVLVAQSFLPSGSPALLRLLDGRTFEERWSLPLRGDRPGAIRFSGDGQRLGIAGHWAGDGEARAEQLMLHATAVSHLVAHGEFAGRIIDFDLDAGLVLTLLLE